MVASQVKNRRDRGEFRIVKPGMPAEVIRLLWPMEMGQAVSSRDLNRARSGLAAADREAMDRAIDAFVDKQFAQIKELQEGDVPEQILAFEKAEMLSKSFPATDAGKEAKRLWLQWSRDSQLRREISALNAFGQMSDSLADAPAPRRLSLLRGFIKKNERTYAATLAEQRVEQEQSERVSPKGTD